MNMHMEILVPLVIVASLAGSVSGQRVVYPYRFDPAEHPDHALRHYRTPTWESAGGRIHAPVELKIGQMNKITRVAGIDKNSFPANLDLKEVHAEIEGWRKQFGARYVGKHVGEEDAGFLRGNRFYEHPFSRLREVHYLSYVDFLDSYGRITDYQLGWGMNDGLAHAAFAQGYVTRGNFQAHHPQYYQVIHAFLRGAAKQYGVMLQGGLTDTYQKSTEAFRKKHMEAYKRAKEKLANMDPGKVTWKEKAAEHGSLHRATEAIDPDGSPFSYSYRFWYCGYQYNLARFRHLEGLSFRGVGRKMRATALTELGKLHQHFEKTFLPNHPDPGGMYTPVAFMLDFHNGWVGKDNSVPHRHLEAIAWDGIPFNRADYQLCGMLQLVYPDYRPNTSRQTYQVVEGGFSTTPFGDCAEVIVSDVRPQLLKQYGLLVLAGEFRTELPLVRKKLTAYLEQGGQVFLCAEQAKAIWPERASVRGKQVVEIPVGKGMLAVSPTPYGLRNEKRPTKGNYSLQLQNHVKAYLRKRMDSLKLFSVGKDLAYIVNRNANGVYTLGIYNGKYKPLPFSIKSHIGKIVEMKEIPTGDVNIIKADPRFYAPRDIKAGSWGSSDGTTIGGGEVRLFHIRVDEQDVRVLDKVVYPPRPKRYLAMGMKNLRRNIMRRPSFFQQFSGVKIDGLDLLATDDAALEYEHGWYRVRHVEMLVETRQITDGKRRQELKRKMALLPYARELDRDTVGLVEGETKPAVLPSIGKARPGKPYLALRRIDDLFRWLKEHPGFFSNFSGVMLDSDYLFQRSRDAWKREADVLRRHGIGMVVDFSGRVRMCRDISFQPTMPFAQAGRDMFANVLQKMQDVSIRDAIFTSPRKWDEHTQKGLETFATMAAKREVTLHLRLMRALEHPRHMAAALKKVKQPNLRAAPNPLAGPKDWKKLPVDLVLLSKVDPETSALLPFHGSSLKAVPKGSTVVFDVEYLAWEEIVRDVSWWNRKSAK